MIFKLKISKIIFIFSCFFLSACLNNVEETIEVGDDIDKNPITIDWSFNSTPSGIGNAKASRIIEVGDTVTWNWYDIGVHNVHNLSSANESFESTYLGPGGSFSFTFTTVGSNPYQCDPHPSNMFGVITVVAKGTLK